jgi:hypothetical protein
VKVAQTPAGDIVLQHGTSSVTLAGIDSNTAVGGLF